MVQVVAPMAGIVLNVLVAVGDTVTASQDVVVLESMKMEVPTASDAAGTVTAVHVRAGDFVDEGQILVEIDEHARQQQHQ